MRMLIVYRLNTSIPSFLCELESLLDELTMVLGELIITGDFNLHCEIPNAPGVKALKDLLAENNLQQHVTKPTHKAGHTLDLVISRESSSIISTTDVYDASISDHFSVLFNLTISDPSSVPKVKLARDMRSFSYTKFEDDLSIKLNKIPLQHDPNTLLQHYELAVGSALDVQAPIKSRTMKCRLRHPWYNDSIHLAREIRRANKNKWRSTKLEVHRQIYVEHRKNVNAMIKQAKMDYFESEFVTGKQDACFRVIKELTQVPGRMLPEASSTKKLCDDFSMFFSEKNQLIREKISIQLAAMDTTITDKVVNNSIVHKLDQFTPTTEKELERIISAL